MRRTGEDGRVPDRPPIAFRALTKRFGTLTAVDHLDLDVPAGSVTGFLGPNGAGKTTALRALTGLVCPTSGDALVHGRPAADPQARRRLGSMPADPAFHEGLSGRRNLDLLERLQGAPSVDRAWACELLALEPEALDRPVGGWSGGMRQKLALVQAVQHRPDVVVLDEPANRLDPLAHRRFEALVRAIVARGGTVFLSSHALAEVQDLCDRVAMVRAGRLLAVRDVAELRDAEPRRVRAVWRDGVEVVVPAGLEAVQVDGRTLAGRLPAGRLDVLQRLLATPGLADLTVEPLSLEEAFADLYGADA
jgi:ABC-2 type transport system ATP-binding protein